MHRRLRDLGFCADRCVHLDAACAGSKRPKRLCHFAHSRSTLAYRRKNSGSFAAVPMLEVDVWASPIPFARPVAVSKNGHRLIPWTPSVFQNWNGLVGLNWTGHRAAGTLGAEESDSERVVMIGSGKP
jgi:hypothetical protein